MSKGEITASPNPRNNETRNQQIQIKITIAELETYFVIVTSLPSVQCLGTCAKTIFLSGIP